MDYRLIVADQYLSVHIITSLSIINHLIGQGNGVGVSVIIVQY